MRNSIRHKGLEAILQVSGSIILIHWVEKRGLGNPRYSRPGGRRYISDRYIFMLLELPWLLRTPETQDTLSQSVTPVTVRRLAMRQ
jgi:hypothetical protein